MISGHKERCFLCAFTLRLCVLYLFLFKWIDLNFCLNSSFQLFLEFVWLESIFLILVLLLLSMTFSVFYFYARNQLLTALKHV